MKIENKIKSIVNDLDNILSIRPTYCCYAV